MKYEVMRIILCFILVLSALSGCQSSQGLCDDFLEKIEADMTIYEVHEILGEPAADIGSGTVIDLYIVSDTHVAVVCYVMKNHSNGEGPNVFRVTYTYIQTYDEFRENFGRNPEDYIK